MMFSIRFNRLAIAAAAIASLALPGQLLAQTPEARRKAYADPVWRKETVAVWATRALALYSCQPFVLSGSTSI